MRLNFIVLLCVGLAACSGDSEPKKMTGTVQMLKPSAMQVAYAEDAEPADARLAEIYGRSCISCHSVDGAGAPLSGHTQEWARRNAARGMSGLVASTVNGRETMPAMGMCADCTGEDFEALINFMMVKE